MHDPTAFRSPLDCPELFQEAYLCGYTFELFAEYIPCILFKCFAFVSAFEVARLTGFILVSVSQLHSLSSYHSLNPADVQTFRPGRSLAVGLQLT